MKRHLRLTQPTTDTPAPQSKRYEEQREPEGYLHPNYRHLSWFRPHQH